MRRLWSRRGSLLSTLTTSLCFCVGLYYLLSTESATTVNPCSCSLAETFKNISLQVNIPVHRNSTGRTTNSIDGKKLILLWTPRWGKTKWITRGLYKCSKTCLVSTNKEDVSLSDAILFHGGDFNTTKDFPLFRLPNQRWVFHGMESPPHTHAPLHSGVFDGLFNWTATYRADSDIVITWGRAVRREQTLPYSVFRMFMKKTLHSKNRVVLARISHCDQRTNSRINYLRELKKYVSVDFYGKCGDRHCPKQTKYCDYELPMKYKFFLAFENSCCRDYITEKFWLPLGAFNSVPIVLGGANGSGLEYRRIAPPNSYINAADFSSAKQLGQFLNRLNKNRTMYEQYFQWRLNYDITLSYNWCDLCDALHDTSRKPQTYAHLSQWYKQDRCHKVTHSSLKARKTTMNLCNVQIR